MADLDDAALKEMAKRIFAEVRQEDSAFQSQVDHEIQQSAHQRHAIQQKLMMLEDRAEDTITWGIKLFGK